MIETYGRTGARVCAFLENYTKEANKFKYCLITNFVFMGVSPVASFVWLSEDPKSHEYDIPKFEFLDVEDHPKNYLSCMQSWEYTELQRERLADLVFAEKLRKSR